MKLLKRKCFKCGKELSFELFEIANFLYNQVYLLEIWNSQHIQLFCCSCYPIEEEKTKSFLENVNSIVDKEVSEYSIIWNHLEHEGDEHMKTHKYGPYQFLKKTSL